MNFLKKLIIYAVILTIAFDRIFSISMLFNRNKQKMSREILDELMLDNYLNMLEMKAKHPNGLTKRDKNLLASIIIDLVDKENKIKQRNTVYWYSRQG